MKGRKEKEKGKKERKKKQKKVRRGGCAECLLDPHLVSWSSNFDDLLDDRSLDVYRCDRLLLCELCCSSRQTLLVLLSLRVRQIAALVGVKGQTKLALVRAQMILHEVGI